LTGTESIDKKFNIRNKKYVVLKKGWMGSKKKFPDPDPGVKKTPNPDPQHFFHAYYIVFFTSALFCCGLLNSNQAQKSPGCETPVLRIRDPG
jgi:hypothetical protein